MKTPHPDLPPKGTANLNLSVPRELKAAIRRIPRLEFPSASAYCVHVLARDLRRRGLLNTPRQKK